MGKTMKQFLFRAILALALVFTARAADAQTQVYQSGTVTAGDPVVWTTSRFIGDATLLGGYSSLLVTSTTPTNCTNDAAVTGAYHQLCFGALNVAGTAGTLLYGAFGGAPTLPFVFSVNGGSIGFTGNAISINGSYGTANGPILAAGSSGGAVSFGTRTGNTTAFLTLSGATTANDCPKFDAFGNLVDSGGSCAASGVNSGTAGQVAYYATTGSTVSGNLDLTISSAALTLGRAGTSQGSVTISGATAGTLSLAVPSSVSTYTITLPSSAPSTGQVITATNGSGTTGWAFPGVVCCTYEATSFNASANTGYCIDTSGGTVTITLEASPANGDAIIVMDCKQSFLTNALTVARNGNLIMNIAQNMTDNTNNGNITLQWDAHFSSWVIR